MYNITNHGLIAAQTPSFNVPYYPGINFTLLNPTPFADLAANSSMLVMVSATPMSSARRRLLQACGGSFSFVYHLQCGDQTHTYTVSGTVEYTGSGGCGGGGVIVGAGGVGGGGSWVVAGSIQSDCRPCPQLIKPIIECAIGFIPVVGMYYTFITGTNTLAGNANPLYPAQTPPELQDYGDAIMDMIFALPFFDPIAIPYNIYNCLRYTDAAAAQCQNRDRYIPYIDWQKVANLFDYKSVQKTRNLGFEFSQVQAQTHISLLAAHHKRLQFKLQSGGLITNADLESAVQYMYVNMGRLNHLFAIMTLYTGDVSWCRFDDQNWPALFQAATNPYSDLGAYLSANETQSLISSLNSSVVTPANASYFLERYNNTLTYWYAGIRSSDQIPAGLSTNFCPWLSNPITHDVALYDLIALFQQDYTALQSEGFSNILDAVQASVLAVQQAASLPPQAGICARVVIQIKQGFP